MLDALRYTEQIQRAAEGGPRDAAILYDKLAVGAPPPNYPVVLIDDLITSEGHMKASARRLEEAGYNVTCGITWAQTVHGTTGIEPYQDGYREIDENWGLAESGEPFEL